MADAILEGKQGEQLTDAPAEDEEAAPETEAEAEAVAAEEAAEKDAE